MPSILSKNFPHSSCSTAVCCTMPSIRDFCCPGTGNTQIVGMCWSTVPPLFSQITWVSTLTCSAKALRSKIKTFSHGSSARWMAYLPHKNESLLLKRGEVQSLAPLHRMELCVWTDLNPMWSRDWFSMNPLLQCWQALCAFCSVPRLQQGRCLWFATLCVHIIVLSLLDGDSPNLTLVHVTGSSPWLALSLQKCQQVPGEPEAEVEFTPSRSLWKPCVFACVLNEQRTCPFFYRDGFLWELCCERDFTRYKKRGKKKKLSWRSEKWKL